MIGMEQSKRDDLIRSIIFQYASSGIVPQMMMNYPHHIRLIAEKYLEKMLEEIEADYENFKEPIIEER